MRVILAFLLSFVLVNVQAYALSGGPPGQAIALNATGTYGGVFIPSEEEGVIGVTPSTSIGLFSVSVPSEGLAQGVTVLFISGAAYNGNITAIVDPDSASFTGVIDAINIYSGASSGDVTIINSAAFAQGSMKAEVEQDFSSGAQDGLRLEGSATVDVFGSLTDEGVPNVSNSESYTVEGFKQSSSVVIPTLSFGNTNF